MALVIAHRGASAAEPENTLAAFRRAVTDGADGIELDVHATADGAIVVHHDADVNGRPIAAMPLADVRRHRLPNGEAPPTLPEALAAIGAGTLVFVEVKHLAAAADAALFAALDGGPDPDRCRVHSFDHRIIRRLQAARPSLESGVLAVSVPVDPVAPVRDAGAAVLWQQHDLIDGSLVEAVHGGGYPLYAWTVDDPARMRALVALGVDGICSNRPDVAREVIG